VPTLIKTSMRPLVMIRTFLDNLPGSQIRSAGGRARSLALAAETGDTLIEVIVGALLIGVVVGGTLFGLNSVNRSTALQRARSQANALAEQSEEQLRGDSVNALLKLVDRPETKTVTQTGTTYTITSTLEYISDTTATKSCSSSTAKADYLQSTSKVTWPGLGTGKAVEESGIISPPAGAAIIAQVTESGAPVSGATVSAVGPAPEAITHTLETSPDGCAILAVAPGEYTLNVSKSGYVDQNWYANSDEDKSASVTRSVYIPAETTTKAAYDFAPAARLNALKFEELNPTSGAHEPAKAFNAVLLNTGMEPSFKLIAPIGSSTYLTSIATEKIVFPFPSTAKYVAFAGTCLANEPPEANRTEITFPAGGEISQSLLLPSLIVRVWTGSAPSQTTLATGPFQIYLRDVDTGTGCETAAHLQETTTTQTTTAGALKYPGQPWGTYTACINVAGKHYTSAEATNTNAAQAGTPINLYEGASTLESGSCPP
jgi:type II secretory pathway pseudopilin PulG